MEQIDPNKAVDYILKNAPVYAQAKAERVYIEEYRKSLKAMLFRGDDGKTIADKEAAAYSHVEYRDLLTGLRAAVEREEKLRWDLIAAQARIEIWRSQEATNRNTDKLLK